METKYIELTRVYDKEPVRSIFINTDKIVYIERRNSKETYIRVQGSEKEGVWVAEGPTTILNRIMN